MVYLLLVLFFFQEPRFLIVFNTMVLKWTQFSEKHEKFFSIADKQAAIILTASRGVTLDALPYTLIQSSKHSISYLRCFNPDCTSFDLPAMCVGMWVPPISRPKNRKPNLTQTRKNLALLEKTACSLRLTTSDVIFFFSSINKTRNFS